MAAEDILLSIVVLAILFAIELAYFKVARRFSIIDKPNERSSHLDPVIRGGGIIFLAGVLFWFVYAEFSWPLFVLGIASAAMISFADDIRSQPARVRIVIHFIAMILVFYTVGLFSWSWWLIILAYIVSVGALNAFNFMDGINGITGIYSLVMLLTFLWIQQNIVLFTDATFIVINVLSILVFLFFNFRKKARCFAGDVGSVAMAFILIFLLLQLVYTTENLLWVLLFYIYGIDSVVTIMYRLKRGENIFKPHRTHLYQYLCNEMKWQHRTVSVIYGIAQFIVNVILIYSMRHDAWVIIVILVVSVPIVYLAVRESILRNISRRPL
jgi:UDP-GlcNAc:undecaprenyl-phosphate/decaprenyl-phosphate GlcNAc-1-phosphate transferase